MTSFDTEIYLPSNVVFDTTQYKCEDDIIKEYTKDIDVFQDMIEVRKGFFIDPKYIIGIARSVDGGYGNPNSISIVTPFELTKLPITFDYSSSEKVMEAYERIIEECNKYR